MTAGRKFLSWRLGLVVSGLAVVIALPAGAAEKQGMPDMCQVEQTCLPTATANLLVWFGKHGYPKLIVSGASEDESETHTVHRIMTDTDARFDLGTNEDIIATGIKKYIEEAGYDCDVEYRDWVRATASTRIG